MCLSLRICILTEPDLSSFCHPLQGLNPLNINMARKFVVIAVIALFPVYYAVAENYPRGGEYRDFKQRHIGQTPPPIDPNDVTSNGPYLVANCFYQSSKSNATIVKSLLERLGVFINQTLIDDTRTGTASHAFQAYFKENDNAGKVEWVFDQIQHGNDLNVGGDDDPPRSPPTITCIRDYPTNDTVTKALQGICRNDRTAMASVEVNSNNIVLCPRFFDLPIWPPSTCPNDSDKLGKTQFVYLMHQLVHLYADEVAMTESGLGQKTFDYSFEKNSLKSMINQAPANTILNAQVSRFLSIDFNDDLVY